MISAQFRSCQLFLFLINKILYQNELKGKDLEIRISILNILQFNQCNSEFVMTYFLYTSHFNLNLFSLFFILPSK